MLAHFYIILSALLSLAEGEVLYPSEIGEFKGICYTNQPFKDEYAFKFSGEMCDSLLENDELKHIVPSKSGHHAHNPCFDVVQVVSFDVGRTWVMGSKFIRAGPKTTRKSTVL